MLNTVQNLIREKEKSKNEPVRSRLAAVKREGTRLYATSGQASHSLRRNLEEFSIIKGKLFIEFGLGFGFRFWFTSKT